MYFRLGTYNKYGYGAEHVLRLRVWIIIIVSIKKTEFRTSDFKYFKIGTNSTTKYSNICVEYLHDFISIHWNLNILQNKNITESKWRRNTQLCQYPMGLKMIFILTSVPLQYLVNFSPHVCLLRAIIFISCYTICVDHFIQKLFVRKEICKEVQLWNEGCACRWVNRRSGAFKDRAWVSHGSHCSPHRG